MTKYIWGFFLFISLFSNGVAQSGKYYRFVLSDSSKVLGKIVYEDNSVIQIEEISGEELRVNKKYIVSKKEAMVKEVKVKQDSLIALGKEEIPTPVVLTEEEADSVKAVFFEDKTENRLFLSPTARNLKKGSGNIGVHEVFLPYVSVGVADRLSVSASLFAVPYIINIFLSAQVNVYSGEYADVAFGGFIASNTESFGLPYFYGVTSIGNDRGFVNIGMGVPYSNNANIHTILFVIGGEYRLSPGGKLIVDNILSSDGQGLFSVGFRTMGEHISFDFGFIVGTSFDAKGFLLPWVGLAYNF